MDKIFKEGRVFQGFTDAEKGLILSLCSEKKLKKGEFLFKENDIGSSVYFVAEGIIQITKKLGEGDIATLAIIREGGIFGELAIISALPRYADALALTDSKAYALEKNDIISLKQNSPKTAVTLIEIIMDSLAERLRKITDRLYGIY